MQTEELRHMTPDLQLLAAQFLQSTPAHHPSARGDVLVSLNIAVMKQESIATGIDARRLLRESPAAAPASISYSDAFYPLEFSQTSSNKDSHSSHDAHTRNLVLEIVFPVAALVLVCIVILVIQLRRPYLYKSRTPKNKLIKSRSKYENMLLESLKPGLPPRFTYAEMHEATRGFEKKLGAGGYGAVYEGILRNGTSIAVKVFLDTASSSCKTGFCAEVMSLGSLRHSNLVELRGFCVEEEHRMLVYELVANGSLDKALFARNGAELVQNSEVLLGWKRRRAIAVDAARALAFLHCEAGVIHCDVKPENILLDEDWSAKMSDFGLAKLVTGGHDINALVTEVLKSSGGARGTFGYAAPEWRKDGGSAAITAASDVYSFGMVLLELVAGRRSFQLGKSFLPGAAFDLLADGHDLEELLDPRLQIGGDLEDLEGVRAVVQVALWCIQEEVDLRPNMATVLEMLAGTANVSPPPMCHFFAGSSHMFEDSATISGGDADYSTNSAATLNSSAALSTSWQISYLSGR